MQYQDPSSKNSIDSHAHEIVTIYPGLDLSIDPSWQEIKTSSDKRIRESLLIPVCEAIRAEKLLIFRLPQALTIFYDYALSKDSSDESKSGKSGFLVKELVQQIALTETAWKDYKAGIIDFESYRHRLSLNAESLMLAVTQHRLMSPYAAANAAKTSFLNSSKELALVIASLDVSESILRHNPWELPPQLKAVQETLQIPLFEFARIRDNIELIRSFINPLKERLIEVNIPLVKSCVDRKTYRGLDREDLIQYGCQGLMIGLENFDLDRKVQFSTYAYPWINQSIMKGIKENFHRGIFVPKGLQDDYRKVVKEVEQSKGSTGMTPSPQEISRAIGIPISTIKKALAIPRLNSSINHQELRARSIDLSVTTIFEHPSSIKESLLRDEIELLKASMKRLPLLVDASHRGAFSNEFNLDEFECDQSTGRNASPQRIRSMNRLTLDLVTCLALVLQRSKSEILRLAKGISPTNLGIILNLKRNNPLSVEKLIEVPIIANEIKRSRCFYSNNPSEKSKALEALMTRSRAVVLQLGNLMTWQSLSDATKSEALSKFTPANRYLFSTYMDRYYDSVKEFCQKNRDELIIHGCTRAPAEVTLILQRLSNQIMLPLRKITLTQS